MAERHLWRHRARLPPWNADCQHGPRVNLPGTTYSRQHTHSLTHRWIHQVQPTAGNTLTHSQLNSPGTTYSRQHTHSLTAEFTRYNLQLATHSLTHSQVNSPGTTYTRQHTHSLTHSQVNAPGTTYSSQWKLSDAQGICIKHNSIVNVIYQRNGGQLSHKVLVTTEILTWSRQLHTCSRCPLDQGSSSCVCSSSDHRCNVNDSNNNNVDSVDSTLQCSSA